MKEKITAASYSMTYPSTPEEWKAYYELERKAKELETKGIVMNFV